MAVYVVETPQRGSFGEKPGQLLQETANVPHPRLRKYENSRKY